MCNVLTGIYLGLAAFQKRGGGGGEIVLILLYTVSRVSKETFSGDCTGDLRQPQPVQSLMQ